MSGSQHPFPPNFGGGGQNDMRSQFGGPQRGQIPGMSSPGQPSGLCFFSSWDDVSLFIHYAKYWDKWSKYEAAGIYWRRQKMKFIRYDKYMELSQKCPIVFPLWIWYIFRRIWKFFPLTSFYSLAINSNLICTWFFSWNR